MFIDYSSSQLLSFTFAFVYLLTRANAYLIDTSCTPAQQNDIKASIQEAIDVASYGNWRVQQKTFPLGQVSEQLLGPNALSVFQEKMKKIPSTFGQYNGIWLRARPNRQDETLIVKCGGQHLVQHPDRASAWIDGDFESGGTLSSANREDTSARPCTQGSGEMARTYLTGLPQIGAEGSGLRGPRFVMMLCEGWNNAALSKPPTLGTLWSRIDWTDVRFGRFAQDTMSFTILHESMHCMRFADLRKSLTGVLPNGQREEYAWNLIQKLPSDSKERNANSYPLLAFVAWLKNHDVSRYGSMGPQKRAARRYGPGLTMPNDPHPK